MSAVLLERVSKSFGATLVLDDISLAIGDSALTAILGPSGSGKTTLLRLIAGFERVDQGSISIAGRVVDDRTTRVRPEQRGIGYVPQDGALFPHLSAAGNIGFGLPRRERHRVDELLDQVGLAGLGQRYPHQLSGGQQQRVALARALAIRPGLILLDEPFSSLDAGLRVSLRRDVAQVLAATGTPAVIVTHDQDEALSLASRIVILDQGHVVGEGSPLELYSAPSTPQAARFLGEANLLPGKLSGGIAHCAVGELDVRGGDALPAGSVTVLIRPEQLRLTAGDGRGGDPDGALGGTLGPVATVTATDYYGHDSLTELRLPDGTTLSARIAGVQPLRLGDRVRIETEGPVIAWPESTDASTDASTGASTGSNAP